MKARKVNFAAHLRSGGITIKNSITDYTAADHLERRLNGISMAKAA